MAVYKFLNNTRMRPQCPWALAVTLYWKRGGMYQPNGLALRILNFLGLASARILIKIFLNMHFDCTGVVALRRRVVVNTVNVLSPEWPNVP